MLVFWPTPEILSVECIQPGTELSVNADIDCQPKTLTNGKSTSSTHHLAWNVLSRFVVETHFDTAVNRFPTHPPQQNELINLMLLLKLKNLCPPHVRISALLSSYLEASSIFITTSCKLCGRGKCSSHMTLWHNAKLQGEHNGKTVI